MAENNTANLVYGERAALVEARVPHKSGVTRTTKFVYDEVGNRTKTITPRGVETTDDPDDFIARTVFDKLNRPKEQLTPFDRDHADIKTPDKTIYTYDTVGQLTEVSTPRPRGRPFATSRSTATSTTAGSLNNYARTGCSRMSDFSIAPEEVLARRSELADKVRRELQLAGLPVFRSVDVMGPAGAEIIVDDGDDAAGGIFVEWNPDPELSRAAADSVDIEDFSAPVIHHRGAVASHMRDAIIGILRSAGLQADGTDDVMRPMAVQVTDG